MLDPQSDQPRIRDAAAQVRELPRTTFACYAQRGDYSAASFLLGLHKIQERLKAQNLSQVGPPRYLYYTTTSWMPWWWRIGEVQVPIAAGGP